MSVDKYLGAMYVDRTYTCLHFANDVWRQETGFELNAELFAYLNGGAANVGMRKSFERLSEPVSPCIVVFKPKGDGETHIGVYLRGRVLHLLRQGVQFQPIDIAAVGFKSFRFYNVQQTINHR